MARPCKDTVGYVRHLNGSTLNKSRGWIVRLRQYMFLNTERASRGTGRGQRQAPPLLECGVHGLEPTDTSELETYGYPGAESCLNWMILNSILYPYLTYHSCTWLSKPTAECLI